MLESSISTWRVSLVVLAVFRFFSIRGYGLGGCSFVASTERVESRVNYLPAGLPEHIFSVVAVDLGSAAL
jgi:hypothetical protein